MLNTTNINRLFFEVLWFGARRRLILLTTLLLFSSLSTAAIYQCKNASGKIAFQDHPCVASSVDENRYHHKTGTTTDDGKKHFLWKATRDKDSVYLLGSIHVGRPDMYPLNSSVMEAFKQSDALMVEVNANDTNQLELAKKVGEIGMYPEGTLLESQIPSEIWEQLVATAKALNVPELLFQHQKPWLASMTLATAMMSKSGYQADYGIDKFFLKQASETKKEIIELESVASQMQLFANLTDQQQLSLLSNSLKEMQQGSVLLDKLVAAWISGDHQAIDQLSRDNMGIDSKDSTLYKKIITDRNHSMTTKILKAMQDHRNYYVVVGAAHLVGAQGIPALLKKQGFAIEEL
jgi:uncharacterized protein YbaP (TraB family)